MDWDSFQIDASYISEKDSALAAKYNDTELVGLKKAPAKREMLEDLKQALNIPDSSGLADILDEHSDRLKNALAYKQMELYFSDNFGVIGDHNHTKFKMYQSKYESHRKKFYELESDLPASVNTIPIMR